MVVVADKMEDTVNDYPVQLLIELRTVKGSILSDGIDANEQVPGYDGLLGIVESDDVREIIMAQILQIDAKYIRIGAENDVDVAKAADFALGDHFQPAVVELPVLVLKLNILKKIPDHRFAQ